MRLKHFLFGFIVFISCALNDLHSQVIMGKVIDSKTKKGIPFASITFPRNSSQERKTGVSANLAGEFKIALNQTPPIILEFSAVGFITKRMTFNEFRNDAIIELNENLQVLESVTVKSEKITETELRAPQDIRKIDLKALQSTPSFNFFDAITNLKGVDMTTESIIINSVNARGFSITGNQRFKQFTDGIDSEAPGLNFTLGNIIGPNSLDIESIELIPGPSTSLFGPSAFNGVLSMKTKNPFDYPGLSISVKGATAAIDKVNKTAIHLGNFIGDLSARYSVAYKDKVGLKVGASYLEGSDFKARNYSNIGSGPVFDRVYSNLNQGIDGVNIYGDDRNAIMVLPLNPTSATSADTAFLVTRQGYREEDLVDYQANNLKLNAEIQFNLSSKTRLNFTSFYAKADAMITGIDRIALRNFQIAQHKIELAGENFLLRGYTTLQNSGNTFNVGLLGDRIVQAAKPHEVWFDQYRRIYLSGRVNPLLGRLQTARELADTSFPGNYEHRYVPGTARYDSIRTRIINSSENGLGAALPDKSKLYNIYTQYDFQETQNFFDEFMVGSNLRVYDPESGGTVFTDSIGNDVTNFQYGLFTQVSKSIDNRTDITASIRYDKNENFKAKLSQRLSAVHKYKDIHYFRFSIQRGFRMPSLREQFLNQDIGDKLVIGGLQRVTDVYDLHNNAFLLNALEEYNDQVIENVANLEAEYEPDQINQLPILENGIVRDGQFTGLKPERITTFELGYRGIVEGKRLFEVTAYRNYYKNFIGNLRLVKPRTSPSIDLAKAAEQANNPATSDLIFVTDNSEAPIITQGVELLYDYSANSGTYFIVNLTFAKIIQDSNDPLTPGFNTTPFKFNVKLGHRKITRNIGAEIAWRGRNDYQWESPFADGFVDGFGTFDVQFSFKIPELNSMIRLGGNNMYNIDEYNTFGGAEINAFYYISLTYDPLQIINPFK